MDFSDSTFHMPVEKEPRVPVRDQLLSLLRTQPVTMSTGGQPHIYLDASLDNCFVVPLTSPYLRGWLTVRHSHDGKPAPTDAQIREVIRVKEAECLGGSTRTLRKSMNVRYAWDPQHSIPVETTDENGNVNHDYVTGPKVSAFVVALNAECGRHVVVTAESLLLHPGKTLFVYDPIQQPMPDPVVPDGDPEQALQPFRKLLRLDDPRHDAAWNSLRDWTLAAMRGPKDGQFHGYPILNLIGPENSGRSVTAKLLTRLIDPTLTPIHSLPTTERRLHGLAANHHVLTFDDPGKLNPEKSRQLSRLASGVSSLHPQLQGMLVRPIILTTTEETETRHLAGKIVDVDLPPIEDPVPQEQIHQQFEEMRPEILGALLALLMDTFDTPPPFLPNRKTRNQKIEESVTELVKAQGADGWTGTATDLCNALGGPPISPESMGRALDHMQSLKVTRLQRKNQERPIHLEAAAGQEVATAPVPCDIPNSGLQPAPSESTVPTRTEVAGGLRWEPVTLETSGTLE